jgi:hypothetical protein
MANIGPGLTCWQAGLPEPSSTSCSAIAEAVPVLVSFTFSRDTATML